MSYNDEATEIKAEPIALYDLGQDMQTRGSAIADSVDRIQSVWRGLKLSWAGATAHEAEKFAQQWDTVTREFFGVDNRATMTLLQAAGGDSGQVVVRQGVLGKVIQSVQGAAYNLGSAEEFAVKYFNSFAGSLTARSDEGDTTRSDDKPPITESST